MRRLEKGMDGGCTATDPDFGPLIRPNPQQRVRDFVSQPGRAGIPIAAQGHGKGFEALPGFTTRKAMAIRHG